MRFMLIRGGKGALWEQDGLLDQWGRAAQGCTRTHKHARAMEEVKLRGLIVEFVDEQAGSVLQIPRFIRFSFFFL